MSTAAAPAPSKLASWRTPMVLIAVGCVIALIAFGPRSALGQFLAPLSFDRGWGREAFSFAIAIQNLLWGAAQPFAGAFADRFGPVRVLCAGAILYAAGLVGMATSTSVIGLDLSAGVMIGFGLAGCSFPMVIGALGKLVPDSWRGFAFGAGTAAGSFGQFLYSPLAHSLIQAFSWQTALLIFAGTMLLVLPLSLALATPPSAPVAGGRQAAIVASGAGRGVRTSQLRAAGARLLHLRLPARLRHRAPAVLSGRPRARRRGRRLDHRVDRPVQHRGLAQRGLALRQDAEALPAVDHLFRPGGCDRRADHACRRARLRCWCSAR